MTTQVIPSMVNVFLKLFKGKSDEEVNADLLLLDINNNGHIDLSEFIMILRVTNYNKFGTIDELISHLKYHTEEYMNKKTKKICSKIALHYKLIDEFNPESKESIDTEEEKKAFMQQKIAFMKRFKETIAFLDTNSDKKVGLDEIAKLIRNTDYSLL